MENPKAPIEDPQETSDKLNPDVEERDSGTLFSESENGFTVDASDDVRKRKKSFRKVVRDSLRYVCEHWWLVYATIIGVFVIFVLVLGPNNLYRQILLSHRIHELENRIDIAEKQYKNDKEYMENRQNDNSYDIEILARKNYGLKEEGEMVFLLVDTLSAEYQKSQKVKP